MPRLTLLSKIIACLSLSNIIIILAILFIPNTPILIALITVALFVSSLLIYYFLQPLYQLLKIAPLLNPDRLPSKIDLPRNEFTPLVTCLNNLILAISNFRQYTSQTKQFLDLEKAKFESIINSIADGIIALDFDNKIIFMNSRASRLTGYQPTEFQNQPFDQLIHVKNQDGIEVNIDRLCTQNPNSLTSQTILNVNGKNTTIANVSITCSHSNPQLPSNIKCTLILHDATREKSLQGLQIDFVSMASHELRTPITSILGYINIYIDEYKNRLTKDQKEFLDRVLVSAQQLATLVDNLLNVSKVERNALSINARTVDWTRTLTRAVDENRLQAAQKNIILSLQLPPTLLPKILADPIRIAEVINNLIGNAINYTPSGGKITVGAETKNDEVITFVKDTGVGIPKEALSHLFTKFYRGQQALDISSNSKGSGLGLFLSKSIIDLHHGRIWVESEVTQGSTFFFSLPQSHLVSPPNLTPPIRS